jgi:hypothetical protein
MYARSTHGPFCERRAAPHYREHYQISTTRSYEYPKGPEVRVGIRGVDAASG